MVGLPRTTKQPHWDIAEGSPVVKSISGGLFSQVKIRRLRSIEIASVVLPILAGLILALLLLAFGPITLPVFFFLIFVLPWLTRDTFRLFIWLIITWPILTLYLRIPLPAGIPDLTYDRILVLLLVCVIILDSRFSKIKLLKATPLDILIIAYVITQLSTRLTLIWSNGIGILDLNGFLDGIIVPVAMFWMTKNLLVSKAHIKWLLGALVIASLLICLTGLIEQALGERVFKLSAQLGGTEQEYEWVDVQGGRAAGVATNPAIYGAVMGIGILAAFCCLSYVKSRFIKVALVITSGVLLYGVFASYTRSAWVSVLIVLFFAQFFLSGLWKRTLPIFMIVPLLLSLVWSNLSVTSTIMKRVTNEGTVNERISVNKFAWNLFNERPLLGWGSGVLNAFAQRQLGISSHNIYITFLVEGGVILFLSFFAVVGYLLMRAVRVYRMTEKGSLERNVLVAMTGSVLIYLLSGLAVELRFFGYFNALFWICIGVIDGLGVRRIWTD